MRVSAKKKRNLLPLPHYKLDHSNLTDIFLPSGGMVHVVGLSWYVSARSAGGLPSGNGLVDISIPRDLVRPVEKKKNINGQKKESERKLKCHSPSHGGVFLLL